MSTRTWLLFMAAMSLLIYGLAAFPHERVTDHLLWFGSFFALSCAWLFAMTRANKPPTPPRGGGVDE